MASDKDFKFMALAKFVGDTFSKDRSTKVGAVIVGEEGEILSLGYNGFCRGYDDDKDENHERPLKYQLVSHAEANSIYNAARVGGKLLNSSIFVSSLPTCIDCTKAIIQAGIKKVHIEQSALDSERWTVNWELSKEMYSSCGVNVVIL